MEGARQVSITNGILPSPSLKEGESTTLAPHDVVYIQAEKDNGERGREEKRRRTRELQ